MASDDAMVLKDWATQEEFAAANGLSVQIVARLRKAKDGLPYRRFGKRVMIHIPTAREWMLKGLITPNPSRSPSRVPAPAGGAR